MKTELKKYKISEMVDGFVYNEYTSNFKNYFKILTTNHTNHHEH